MISIIFWIATMGFLAGSNYNEQANKQGYGLFDKNRGKGVCHHLYKEFDGFDKNMAPKCKESK